MSELFTYGEVGGAGGNPGPYPDCSNLHPVVVVGWVLPASGSRTVTGAHGVGGVLTQGCARHRGLALGFLRCPLRGRRREQGCFWGDSMIPFLPPSVHDRAS
jgi:hypothetical protein